MKLVKIALMTIALASMGLATTACGNQAQAATEEQGKEYTSNYICPMHCEGSGSEEMGQCPACGMDYVMNENYQGEAAPHEGHNHDGHDHEGHDHSHDGHDHDHQH